MVTLHAYVLRELLKTFLLTLTLLTILFTLGGGLYNLVRNEGVSTNAVIGLMPYLIPIVVTLFAMPISALFAAALVYGRLAADNELSACRAAGINVQRLFLAALLLGIFVSGFTLFFGNFVVPRMMRSIESVLRSNVRDWAAQQLLTNGYVHYGGKRGGEKFTLSAERVLPVLEADLRAGGWEIGERINYLHIIAPMFIQTNDRDEILRFATAKSGVCKFDGRNTEKPIEITLFIQGARDYEVGRSVAAVDQQQFKVSIPLPSTFRLSFSDLASLLEWQRAPWTAGKLANDLATYRAGVGIQQFYEECRRIVESGGSIELTDPDGRKYRISGGKLGEARKGLRVENAEVLELPPNHAAANKYLVPRLTLVARATPSGELFTELSLDSNDTQSVRRAAARGSQFDEPRTIGQFKIDGARPAADWVQRLSNFSSQDVLDPRIDLPVQDQALRDKRDSLRRDAEEMLRKIKSTIHFRFGFTTALTAAVLLGAVLGVIFRGAHILMAFVIALGPLISLLILSKVGQQLTESARTTQIGPWVTWGSVGVYFLVVLATMRIGVRR